MKPLMELVLDPLKEVELESVEYDQSSQYSLHEAASCDLDCHVDVDFEHEFGGGGGGDDSNGQGSLVVTGMWRKGPKGLAWEWLFPRHHRTGLHRDSH